MSETPAAVLEPTAIKVAKEIKYDASPLIACRFDPTGKYVFACGQDNLVLRVDCDAGSFTPMKGHDSWVRAIGFCVNPARCWTGGYDGRLIEWDAYADSPVPLRSTEAHQGWIRSLDVSPDEKWIATGGNDQAVRIWDAGTGQLRHTCAGHDRHVYSVLFSRDGETLYSGDLRGVVKRWNVQSGAELATYDAKQLYTPNPGQGAEYGGVRSMTIVNDRHELVCGGLHNGSNPFGAVQEPLVVVLGCEDGKAVRTHTAKDATKGVVWRVVAHPQGFLIGGIGGSGGGYLCFWKGDGETEFHRFGLPNTVLDMDLSRDSQRIATVHYDRHVRISQWD
ncbi:MAG: hypothetical protein R3E01_11280 [Pirellulaceae bacterium]|nr:hypothetical protein [Planctomycetales bacterium]